MKEPEIWVCPECQTLNVLLRGVDVPCMACGTEFTDEEKTLLVQK